MKNNSPILLVLLVMCLIACNSNVKTEDNDQILAETNEQKYVNALSGLNYRDAPKGSVLGKFENGLPLKIVHHSAIFEELKDEKKILKGEWVGVLLKKDTVYVFDAFLSLTNTKADVWSKFTLKNTPLIDSTNFDNIDRSVMLTKEDIATLQLKKVYQGKGDAFDSYKFSPSYKLPYGKYNSIVVYVFKGDHEIESVLVIYDSNNNIIEYYNEEGTLTTNSIVLAYDEIAEGWSRTTSSLKNKCITTIDALYTDIPVIDTIVYHVNQEGYINKVHTDFKNNIRANKPIKLHTTYTDTIQFTAYNDNGDYFLLEGKKNKKNVSLIYNWDWDNDKYNYKYGDFIKVTWKMDSIYIAGDGETLMFSEIALDAEKTTISENKPVKFLWREDTVDPDLNETVNTLFINEAYCSSISNQEKAALGYVAFHIGNECWWDGEAKEDRSNLKCKILTSLDLGYQCSDKQVRFLQKWFSKDALALKNLESCGTTPYTSTIQDTFENITITTNQDLKTIVIHFTAYGINFREARKWTWTQTDTFTYDEENITLLNSEKSELIREKIEISGG